ncbi:MAG: NUDIX hydrolase [Candidatus Hodarchaeales archaeon]|jgi:8-oxo-dGTP diphosphatase
MSLKQKLATLCYLYHNNKLLLLHRVKKINDMHEGKFIGIGGKMEPYESPRDCMLREIEEESGIKPKDLTLRASIYFKEAGNGYKHDALNYLVFVYRVTEYEGIIPSENTEGKFVWKSLEEFNQLNVWEGDKIFVPKLINEDRFFEATFIYTPDEQLVEYMINET